MWADSFFLVSQTVQSHMNVNVGPRAGFFVVPGNIEGDRPLRMSEALLITFGKFIYTRLG